MKKRGMKWLLLCLAVAAGALLIYKYFLVEPPGPVPDMSLERELAQADEIIDLFFASDVDMGSASTVDYEHDVEQYIPEGAWCTDSVLSGEVFYVDYQLDGIRYIVGYRRDGTVEKGARGIDSDETYYIDSTDGQVVRENVRDNTYNAHVLAILQLIGIQ